MEMIRRGLFCPLLFAAACYDFSLEPPPDAGDAGDSGLGAADGSALRDGSTRADGSAPGPRDGERLTDGAMGPVSDGGEIHAEADSLVPVTDGAEADDTGDSEAKAYDDAAIDAEADAPAEAGEPDGGICIPNPDDDGSCAWICPETCDDADNDCDGLTDEPQEACVLPNATGRCGIDNLCEIVECDPAFGDCNQRADDGCETRLDSPEYCGSCDNDCTQLPNIGEVGCDSGDCVVQSCANGYGDCSADPGCETRLNTPSRCGRCDRSCPANGGTPVCSEGTCDTICDLSGTFALKVTADVTWPARPWMAAGSGVFASWSKLEATHTQNELTGTLTECGKDAPHFASSVLSEWYKVDYPPALFDAVPSYLPHAAADATLSGASPGATYELDSVALLMGASMADSIDDAWPGSAADLTQVDMDGDGKPGVSAAYQQSGDDVYAPTSVPPAPVRADTPYVAARVVFWLSGTLTSCTQSSGLATVTQVNTRIFGCNRAASSQDCDASEGAFLDDNQVNYQPGAATYTLVKVADAATCSDVRAALP